LEAKKSHPAVSGFTGGNLKKIVELQPDLVIGFSDIQAQLAKDLIARNIQVLIFNQRSIQEILDVILVMGRLVGKEEKAKNLVRGFIDRFVKVKLKHKEISLEKRPKVYFEEWNDPMISGIRWVSELIQLAGGQDIFSDRAHGPLAKERFCSPEEVVQRMPDLYIGSWCGEPVNLEEVRKRPGWGQIPAVQNNRLYEMEPSIILQPGPACLTDGFDALEKIIGKYE
jgi:iron complex transport system substrate-binding protein